MRRRASIAGPVVCVLLLVACPVATAQPPDQRERIAASFVLALGRTPTAVEAESWAKQEASSSLATLLERHAREIARDAARQRAVLAKAGEDAFGATPENAQLEGAPGGIYAEVMRRHINSLGERPADYERVVHRAYQRLLERDAYSVEIEYWRRQAPLSFALLVACIDDWARRNQPGLMYTTGVASASVNSAYLATARLSPAAAAEARRAIGLAPDGDRARASVAERCVIAPGGAGVTSVGGIHFAAAGAVDLLLRGQRQDHAASSSAKRSGSSGRLK